MTLEIKSKKGGPYTKREQEKRRKQVYELHFEKGFSAVSIANEIDVNRNTINDDIKYWQMQFASQFEDQDLGGIILKQIERLEIQRRRLLEQLEQSELDEKLRIEKMIFEMDYKITGFVSKIAERKIPVKCKPKVSQEEASQILKEIIFSENVIHPECVTHDDILRDIVVLTGCDAKHASSVCAVFVEMGLNSFQDEENGFDFDLISFIRAKAILTPKEEESFEKKIKKNQEIKERHISEIQKKYVKKYGAKIEDWPYSVKTQMAIEIEG